MKATLTALALAASVLGSAAPAQDVVPMGEALSMLEISAQRQLRNLGFDDVDVMSLTLSQLATIKGITDTSDFRRSEQKSQIDAILAH